MRMIKTYEGMTMNCDVIATIQSVFMNITTGSISEMVDDGFDPDNLEFAVTAFTTFGDEIVLAVYATEEERDYARYKLENWLVYDVGSYYTMTERKLRRFFTMKKMIVTEYSRPIMLNKVKEFVQRTMYLAENKVIPYAVFALLDSGEMVNIGNFNDADTAEIIRIILDIFAEDKKAVFDVNLEVFGIRNFLEMLRYVSADSDSVYRIMINELKQQLKSGELDVNFS